MTIDKETRTEILRLYHAEKWKIGTIARQLGVHHGDDLVAEVTRCAGHAAAVVAVGK